MILKYISLLILSTMMTFSVFAQNKNLINNMRSDTVDVLEYKIEMDFTDMGNQNIEASAQVKFAAKMDNVSSISLDLLELTVDSVMQGNNIISFSYNDTLLVAQLINPINENQVDSVTVFYQGTPPTDNSGLGGFYFMGNNAFNFGVGFEADPHNFGRVWHPCFDNFVERATYDITIISPPTLFSYSVGYIENEFVDGSGNNVRQWKIDEPIPSYLSGLAVSDYTHVSDSYLSPVTGLTTPIMLIAKEQDTSNVKSSFVNLKNAMEAYEMAFGPYQWNKVGYIFVPLSSAAMEHATAIVHPQAVANGTLQYETLMAHELAHSWWGNLTNCKTSEDMWINEGFTSFCEPLFLEYVYGQEAYINEITSFHRTAIQQAHFNDGAYYPLSGVPHSATYGTHSYTKGATIVHNLRTYMGDVDFFSSLKDLLSNNQFAALDAQEFKDELATYSGQNLDDFFDGWIFNPGYPGFKIDSLNIVPNGSTYDIEVFVKQGLHQAPNYYNNVPMEVTFVDADMNEYSDFITISGMISSEVVNNVPFEPVLTYLNKNHGILNAVTGVTDTISTTGMKVMDYAYARVQVQQFTDSILLRVEHHRVAPTPFENPGLSYQFEMSTERFWRIDGVLGNDFEGFAQFFYDGRNIAGGNLDNELMVDHGSVAFHEDSIVLLWREGSGHEWQLHDDFELVTLGNPTDGFGRIQANNIQKGEYTFGVRVNLVGTEELDNPSSLIEIYPNPAKDKVTFMSELMNTESKIKITDLTGKTIELVNAENKSTTLSIKNLAKGTYIVHLINNGKSVDHQRFLVQ